MKITFEISFWLPFLSLFFYSPQQPFEVLLTILILTLALVAREFTRLWFCSNTKPTNKTSEVHFKSVIVRQTQIRIKKTVAIYIAHEFLPFMALIFFYFCFSSTLVFFKESIPILLQNSLQKTLALLETLIVLNITPIYGSDLDRLVSTIFAKSSISRFYLRWRYFTLFSSAVCTIASLFYTSFIFLLALSSVYFAYLALNALHFIEEQKESLRFQEVEKALRKFQFPKALELLEIISIDRQSERYIAWKMRAFMGMNQIKKALDLGKKHLDIIKGHTLLLTQDLAFRMQDYELVRNLSLKCWEVDPNGARAWMHAIAFAQVRNKEICLGWIIRAFKKEKIPRHALQDPLFDFLKENKEFQKLQIRNQERDQS